MKNFNNDANVQRAHDSSNVLLWGCFWLSAFTTTVTMSAWAAELTHPYISKLVEVEALVYHLACFCGLVYFFYRLEVFIGEAAHVFFTEFAGLLASASGHIAAYSGVRKVSLVFWGAIFVVCAAFSAITSLSGAVRGAAAVMQTAKTDDVRSLPEQRQKAIAAATKQQADKLNSLKTERDAAVAKAEAQLDKNLLRSARKGDALAQKEVRMATASASRPYTAKIEKAQAELDKETEAAGKRQDGIDGIAQATAQVQLKGIEQKSQSMGWLARLLGLAPLAIGIAIKGTRAMSEVATVLPSNGAQARPTVGAGAQQASGAGYAAKGTKYHF
jgi:hypothetical protein